MVGVVGVARRVAIRVGHARRVACRVVAGRCGVAVTVGAAHRLIGAVVGRVLRRRVRSAGGVGHRGRLAVVERPVGHVPSRVRDLGGARAGQRITGVAPCRRATLRIGLRDHPARAVVGRRRGVAVGVRHRRHLMRAVVRELPARAVKPRGVRDLDEVVVRVVGVVDRQSGRVGRARDQPGAVVGERDRLAARVGDGREPPGAVVGQARRVAVRVSLAQQHAVPVESHRVAVRQRVGVAPAPVLHKRGLHPRRGTKRPVRVDRKGRLAAIGLVDRRRACLLVDHQRVFVGSRPAVAKDPGGRRGIRGLGVVGSRQRQPAAQTGGRKISLGLRHVTGGASHRSGELAVGNVRRGRVPAAVLQRRCGRDFDLRTGECERAGHLIDRALVVE